MDPINYVASLNDPTASVMAGYQTGLSNQAAQQNMNTQRSQLEMQQAQEARAAEMQPYNLQQAQLGVEGQRIGNQAAAQNVQAQSTELARREAFRADMAALTEKGPSATLQDFIAIETKYPELAGNIRQGYDAMDEAGKRTMGTVLAQGVVALQNNKPEMAKDLFNQYAEAMEASGDAAGAASARSMTQMLDADPNAVLPFAGLALNMLMPDVAGSLFSAGQEFTVLSPEEATSLGLPAGSVYQRGADGKITQVGGSGVNVEVNTGEGAGNSWGEPPKDTVWLRDAQGEVITEPDPSGRGVRPVSTPIVGGSADTSRSDASAQEATERSGGIVQEDIERALNIISQNPNWTTGLGARLRSVPGTQAKTLDGLLTTIKANVGFDRLQQMRDASPTGGALGAINKTEMDLLQAVIGNLDQSLDDQDLIFNLNRINEVYNEIIHGRAATRGGQTPQATPQPAAPVAMPSFMQFSGGN